MTLSRITSHSVFKWLYPGMHIKRWLLLLVFGISLMGLGFAYILKEAYLNAPLPEPFYYLTLQLSPRRLVGFRHLEAQPVAALCVYSPGS